MPIPWIPVPAVGEYRVPVSDQEVVILSKSQRDDLAAGVTIFSEGVTVLYGPTKITADQLIVRRSQDAQNATASGNVIISDPDFSFRGRNLFLQWKPGSREATAEDFEGEIAGATLRARSMSLKEGKWTLLDVRGTTCPEDAPHYEVRSPKLEFVPGEKGKIWNPTFYALGARIVTIPSQSFNLDRRVDGIGFPRLTITPEGQIGAAWGGNFLLDPQTGAGFSLGTRQGSYPSASISLTRTFLSRDQSEARIRTRDDLADRFNGSWFDSIEVSSSNNDFRRLGQRRSTAFIGSTLNRSSTNWPGEIRYTKPIEFGYEQSQKFGDIAGFGDVRVQTLQSQDTRTDTRIQSYVAAATDVLPISRSAGIYARFDASATLGRNAFGWGRSMAGVVYRPTPWLDLGAAGVLASEFGTTDFQSDRLYATSGVHVRADLRLGPTRASYLYKYDVGRKWYDREWSVNQVAGCVELFVQSREYPQSYRYGIKLRVDRFVDLIQSRRFERPADRRTPISTPEAR